MELYTDGETEAWGEEAIYSGHGRQSSSRSPSPQLQVSELLVGFFSTSHSASGRHEAELPSQHRKVKPKAPGAGVVVVSLFLGRRISQNSHKARTPCSPLSPVSREPS